MNAPRWREIGEQDRARLRANGWINGCGPKTRGLDRVVPDRWLGLHLEDSCDHHDWNYTLGGTEADRIKADWQFYESMKERARRASSTWWRRPLRVFYLLVAWTYYRAVRWGGARTDLFPGRWRQRTSPMSTEEFEHMLESKEPYPTP